MGYSLVNIWESSDHHLFDDIAIPEGVDKVVLVNTLFDEAGELEPISPNPILFKAKVDNFFSRNLEPFKRMCDALDKDYEALENYDRNASYTTEGKVSAFDSNDYENTNLNTTSERIHGNIGVTTSQQMLESEIKLRTRYNIYKLITDKFIDELIVSVY